MDQRNHCSCGEGNVIVSVWSKVEPTWESEEAEKILKDKMRKKTVTEVQVQVQVQVPVQVDAKKMGRIGSQTGAFLDASDKESPHFTIKGTWKETVTETEIVVDQKNGMEWS